MVSADDDVGNTIAVHVTGSTDGAAGAIAGVDARHDEAFAPIAACRSIRAETFYQLGNPCTVCGQAYVVGHAKGAVRQQTVA